MTPLVIDTNIALDVLVFADESAREIGEGLEAGRLQWLATAHMREELARVLRYPQIQGYLQRAQLAHDDVLARFDRHVVIVETPAAAALACSDADDQKFIDLAIARQCILLSKDRAVLSLRKRLAALGCIACETIPRRDDGAAKQVRLEKP